MSLYPPVFDCSDPLGGWKPLVFPVPCAFCKGIISQWTDLRIPDCGHSYHVSYVCFCFGVNFLVCWKEDCGAIIPLSWVKEFNLDRELNLSVLEERISCSVDMRSLLPSKWDGVEDLTIVGVPAMRVQKREFLESLEERLTTKTCDFVLSSKTGPRARLYPPPHRVAGDQFKKWTQLQNGVKCSDWTEHFARGLLVLPWTMEILRVLVSRQFVSAWRTGLIPMEVLESSDSYKVEDDYRALKWA
ncbi:hypothetical protein R1sor_009155 [Riccia sorocarpa]|uniref:Uncharacterized protein n=1 Tax=Riccia sorocarpa TaxID=122646 RepID=A0ABD3H6Y3_9MARC